jgi:TolB-like protein
MSESSTRAPSVPQPSGPRFELRCWGEFRLYDRVQRAECSPQSRKARALVAYLAAHSRTPISRERLATLLWSERGDQQARASLRQTLFEIRSYATDGARLLVIDHDQVQLDGLALTSDVARLEALARSDDLDALSQALADTGDRFYDGLDGLDPAFDEWLALERRRQQEHVLALCAAAATRGLHNGAHGAVAGLATALQAFDETNETVAQIGMKADHACSDCSAVRRRYRRLREALKEELGAAPSQETETLLGDLTRPERRSTVSSAPAPLAQAAPSPQQSRRPSIAVLPFVNRSGFEADDVFADGMIDDLTAALSVTRNMKVITASATAAYSKGAHDVRQIGRELDVRYLLEGNVRRLGDNLRVSAQLVEAESGDILWSHKFSRPLAVLSALQEDLAADLAAHLGVQVERVEMEHALSKQGVLTAAEADLRMKSRLYRSTQSSWEAYAADARRTIEIDPDSSVGYSSLAVAQAQLFTYHGRNDSRLAQEITNNIRRAVALDPNNPDVLAGVASAMAHVGALQDALSIAERAVGLDPTHGGGRMLLGSILIRLGRMDEGLAELDVSEQRAPNGPQLYYSLTWRSVAHLRAGRLEMALDAANRARRLFPGAESVTQGMLCLAKTNQWDRAHDALRRLRETDPDASCGTTENFVRFFYCGSNAIDEYIAIVRRIWGDAASEPQRA